MSTGNVTLDVGLVWLVVKGHDYFHANGLSPFR